MALDELVRVMTPVLWHVVRAYRLTSELAEDVVQTTWLSLVKSRASIQEPAAVGGWLTTTARREAWKVAKATGRGIPVEDDELARRLPDEGSAEAEVVRRDGDERLWDAVERLSERCQALLRIVAFEHRPDYTTIAADLGMPVGSIGPTRGRCLQKLRVALIETNGESDDELTLSATTTCWPASAPTGSPATRCRTAWWPGSRRPPPWPPPTRTSTWS